MSDLDHKFKQALEGYTELPSPELWDRISAAVDEQSGPQQGGEEAPAEVPAPKKKGGLIVVWRKQLLSAASAAAAIALLWTLSSTPTPSYDSRELRLPTDVESDLTDAESMFSPVEEALENMSTETVVDSKSVAAVAPKKVLPVAPRWEARLEEQEAEMALNEDLLTLDAVRSELVQEPVKVILDFVPTPEKEETYYASTEEPGRIGQVVGQNAKNLGTGVAKIIGKGYLNWEQAKLSVNNTLATLNTKKTPKN